MREWYVYVPESVKAQPEKPVPLVFALHGYTCAGEIYAGNSEWYKAADQHGFLVVHPTATPGQMEMENQVCSIQNVPLPALPDPPVYVPLVAAEPSRKVPRTSESRPSRVCADAS